MSSIRVRETSLRPPLRRSVPIELASSSTKTFRLRSDATAFKRKIDGDELAGLVTNRRGGESGSSATTPTPGSNTDLVKGRPLTPATRQGYNGTAATAPQACVRPAPSCGRSLPKRVRLWHGELRRTAPDQAAKAYRVLRAHPQHRRGRRAARAQSVHHPGRWDRERRGASDAGHDNRPASGRDVSSPGSAASCCWVGSPDCVPASCSGSKRHDVNPLQGTVSVVPARLTN